MRKNNSETASIASLPPDILFIVFVFLGKAELKSIAEMTYDKPEETLTCYYQLQVRTFFVMNLLQQIYKHTIKEGQLLWPDDIVKQLCLLQASAHYYPVLKQVVQRKIRENDAQKEAVDPTWKAILHGLVKPCDSPEYKEKAQIMQSLRQRVVAERKGELDKQRIDVTYFSSELAQHKCNLDAVTLFLLALSTKDIATSQLLFILDIQNLFNTITALPTAQHPAWLCLDSGNKTAWNQLLIYGLAFLQMLVFTPRPDGEEPRHYTIGICLAQDRYFDFLKGMLQVMLEDKGHPVDHFGYNIAHYASLLNRCVEETRSEKTLKYLLQHRPQLFQMANTEGKIAQQMLKRKGVLDAEEDPSAVFIEPPTVMPDYFSSEKLGKSVS